ncbi:unnamed protein product [Prorocentrum cordatum]|uniref:PPPDE domain-containing protein n=1 Tax=Prorocentrum cordatum TaxID=2364126 RepID=A0ABN9X2T8_9DINO|nr:unnamed protein product [Polarella glacialis]
MAQAWRAGQGCRAGVVGGAGGGAHPRPCPGRRPLLPGTAGARGPGGPQGEPQLRGGRRGRGRLLPRGPPRRRGAAGLGGGGLRAARGRRSGHGRGGGRAVGARGGRAVGALGRGAAPAGRWGLVQRRGAAPGGRAQGRERPGHRDGAAPRARHPRGGLHPAQPRAGEVGSLLGDALGSEYKGLLPHFLQQAPTPAAHAYAVLETSKARVFITERVHDGRVLLENLGDGSMAPFAHGRELGAQPMEAEFRAAGHSGAHPGPALGRLPAGAASAQPTPFAAARVEGGPPVAAVGALARAESLSDYDLLKANCQHYANDVFKVVSGHPLKKLPNQELIAAARMFGIGGPALSPAVAAPSALEQLRWAAGQAPVRLAAAAAVACAPAPGARCAEDGGSGGA